MSTLIFEGQACPINGATNVLEALLQNGHEIPNGCRSGVCQACVLSADEGTIPAKAQTGLSTAQISLNQFLSCQCAPASDLVIRKSNQSNRFDARVIDKTLLNAHVLRLRLASDNAPIFRAGQYVTVWKDDTVARSYSIASRPDEAFIELHIKRIKNGVFSQWAAEQLNVGDVISLQGPMGKCIYSAAPDQHLLLAAIGTGLAPIYGILKDALAQRHKAPIELVIGARSAEQLYLVDELRQLATLHDNLNLHFLTMTDADAIARQADIYQYVKTLSNNYKSWRVFLCGGQSFVGKLRKQVFLAGASMADISADTFLSFSSKAQ